MRTLLLALILLPIGGWAQDKKPATTPVITVESLKARIAELNKQKVATERQALADINAYNGAIQDCEYWIDQLTPKPTPPPPPVKVEEKKDKK